MNKIKPNLKRLKRKYCVSLCIGNKWFFMNFYIQIKRLIMMPTIKGYNHSFLYIKGLTFNVNYSQLVNIIPTKCALKQNYHLKIIICFEIC